MIFKKFGGAWNRDEIVFHYKNPSDILTDQDKQKIVDLIF